jgi:hypothetical protein
MSDLSNTRTLEAEHTYPTPTRNLLSMHNREAAKRTMGRPGKTGEVRRGYRTPEGNSVMFLTDSEVAAIRQAELQNKLLDRQMRKAEMMAKLNARMAEIDSWAHHS